MQSGLGWIDFSSLDRDRIKTVLNLLADPGMVDELGIGSIRDSFSDALFPGISTIQTRAKYFITVPRIIRDFELMTDAQRRRAGGLARYLSDQEDACARLFAKPFAALPEEQQQGTGIIGISALDTGVLRKPSEIYWGGLRTFGLIDTRLSRAEFCRVLDQPAQTLRATLAGSDKEQGDDRDAVASSSLVRLPSYDPQWRENLSVSLTNEEAGFLLNQMNQPALVGSLWSELLQKEDLRKLILSDGVTFPSLPELLKGKVPGQLSRLLQQAVDFWDLLEGAHIRYNVLLQKKFGNPDLLDQFEEQWVQWCTQIETFDWSGWSVSSLWSLAGTSGHNIREFTRVFVEKWCEEIRRGFKRPEVDERLDDLVARQELRNKGKKSRLHQTEISIRQWIGIADLNYRFPKALRLLKDLQEGVDSNA